MALADALLEESGVAVLPGSDFYMPATSLSCRVAGVDFDGQKVLNSWPGAANVTAEYIQKYLPKIEQGCASIHEFLDKLGKE